MPNQGNGRCMSCMRETGGQIPCPYCGYEGSVPSSLLYLKEKTILNERYIVGRLLHYNGEGATYIGFDKMLGTKVMIREFVPDTLCTRFGGAQTVTVFDDCALKFKSLKLDFIDMARGLSKLSNISGIVPVLDVFEANGTAYATYEYFQGIPYEEFLNRSMKELTWEQAKMLFMPLLVSLDILHKKGIIHRGISPQTIYINKEGDLKLFGFCLYEARTMRTELSPELFGGYAAPEQYNMNSWQGTWTDIYSIGAVLYKSLTGVMPPESRSRAENDVIVPVANYNPSVPRNVANAVSGALMMSPQKRTSSMEQFIDQLNSAVPFVQDDDAKTKVIRPNRITAEEIEAKYRAQNPQEEPQKEEEQGNGKDRHYLLLAAGISLAVLLISAGLIFWMLFGRSGEPKPSSSSDIVSESSMDSSGSQGESSESSDISGSSGTGSSGEESEDMVTVPDMVGQKLETVMANTKYTEKLTIVSQEKFDDTYPAGTVVGQSLTARTEVKKKAQIVLTVSKGPETVPMPNIEGRTQPDVQSIMEALHIKCTFYSVYDESVPVGTVVRADRDEGQPVKINTEMVSVFISAGKG